ncbi:MAG: phytoene desaturase family protein [Longimicrobiales bacterium]|nr:phytoene desaturase family protein [Longimicrobiales bacterium]
MSRKAVVIGSGFGGLSLAVRLQAAGLQVTLLEKRELIGGRAYQLKDAGYTFDMGPSLITAPEIIDSVFRAGGRRFTDYVDLVPLDPYYRIYFHDGTHIDYVGDVERMREQMARFDKEDAANLDRFLARTRPIYDAIIADRLGSKPFDTVGSMVRFMPTVLKLGAFVPVTTFVNRFFKDFRHRFIFSFHPLFVGGNPFKTPSSYLMIPYLEREGGVWFTRGGMYSVVEAMGRLFTELGGTIRTEAEVEEIVVEDGRAVGVRVSDEIYPADVVASNADPGHTYGKLVPAEHRPHWNDKRLARQDWSMSCVLLYIGTRRQYPQLEHHTLILTERYRELLDDIFDEKILPEDFSMYLHAPTRTDPAMAPPGCESMYVLIPVANKLSGIDWSEMGPRFADRVMDFLEEWGLEDLREATEVLHVFTPDDFETELNATWGNAFAIEPKLFQTAWFRPQNRSEDVDGLYLVGAGTHPGAGVPGVILSAETTYGCIAADLGLDDQWDWDEPASVALAPELEDEVVPALG